MGKFFFKVADADYKMVRTVSGQFHFYKRHS